MTAAGVVQLFQITVGGHGRQIADLPGVSAPQSVAVAGGALAILQNDGSIAVFTTCGKPLATIAAHATSIAITQHRVVARTRERRLAVYGLRGGLVHSWPLGAAGWTAGLATDGRYAVYLGQFGNEICVVCSDGATLAATLRMGSAKPIHLFRIPFQLPRTRRRHLITIGWSKGKMKVLLDSKLITEVPADFLAWLIGVGGVLALG